MKTRMISIIYATLMFVPLVAIGQQSISGTVKDNHGEPIFGAVVKVKNTYLGAVTDHKGAYQINGLKKGEYLLEARFTGFLEITKKITVEPADILLNFNFTQPVQLIPETLVEVTRANAKTPTTHSDLGKSEIETNNYGQDLPYLMRFTTAAVVTSDAGAGVGYTGIRIRGVDPTRTNVTINGIPLNDSESHGVYWVDMPDFASSVENIQIQRGVGTSSNGAAAFGASINIKADEVNKEAYGVIDNGYGSFNTWRHTVKAGTGLINNSFTVDARLSKIASEGYIDRASSDLKSFYLSGAWLGKNATLRANIFSGKEKTYQAWYGTPESVVKGTEEDIIAYADRNWIFGQDRDNLTSSGRTYNYYTYENEVDNYQQDHYQLHFSARLNKKINVNLSGHYTRGRGYYEQFRESDDLSDYGLEPLELIGSNDTIEITSSDIIRRRWLDNHFYGGIFSLKYFNRGLNVTFGGGANNYLGGHYGEIIWAEFASNGVINQRYYDNDGNKFEAQSYIKLSLQHKRATYFADIQYRHIDYTFLGIDEVNGVLENTDQTATYDFVNPKIGFMIDLNHRNNVYASFAVANREPVRSDFRENTKENRPSHEQLMNTEIGYHYKGSRLFINADVYHMYYKNQLALTGQINDVGGYTRTNVAESYRAGIELDLGYSILQNLKITANLALSQNKITAFTEYIDEYASDYSYLGQAEIEHTNTDLAFSPDIITSLGLMYSPVKGLDVGLVSKYVGDQYLDNTKNQERKLDAYFIANLQISYTLKNILFKEIRIAVGVNNIFDQMYENNGYTWGYVVGGERTDENFLYPQAGRHFLTRLTIKL